MKPRVALLLFLGLFIVAAPCVFAFAPVDLNQDGTVEPPNVGPVAGWERKGVQGGTVESSYSKYGLLQYCDVGGVHHP